MVYDGQMFGDFTEHTHNDVPKASTCVEKEEEGHDG